ncbi:Protein of unknown function [Gryllus bimaculatus]|nr:Protein of unknown function [Gryllus bimaculatus]
MWLLGQPLAGAASRKSSKRHRRRVAEPEEVASRGSDGSGIGDARNLQGSPFEMSSTAFQIPDFFYLVRHTSSSIRSLCGEPSFWSSSTISNLLKVASAGIMPNYSYQ